MLQLQKQFNLKWIPASAGTTEALAFSGLMWKDKYMDSETDKQIAIFEGQKIRRHWDSKEEKWYFSVSDVVAVLTNSIDPLAYWRKLKERLIKEGGNETVTKCHALKMVANDGKMRFTDTADIETLLRLIQSVPSPKAEPFKLWLARVGYERMQETVDPERGLNRARQN